MIELGSGRLVPGLRGAARGRRRRRGAARSPSRSPTTTAPTSSPARRPSSPSPCARSRPSSCPQLDDELAEEAGFDTLDELREDIRSRLAETETQRIEARVPRGGARRRGRGGDDRGARQRWSRRARASCGTRCCTQLSHQGIDRETLPADLGPHRGGHDRAGQAGRRAGAQARGGAGGGGRGRVARADRGGDARGGRARRRLRARRRRRRSCWSACAPTGAWTASRTTCRSARRWTWSRSRPSRFRSPSSRNPDARVHNLAERPGSDRSGPLLVFGRVVRHGPSSHLKDSSVRSETKRGP